MSYSKPEVKQASNIEVMRQSENDNLVRVAKLYPRDLDMCKRTLLGLVTSSEQFARECIYSLPRGKGEKAKVVNGPSARFSEAITHSFGNIRAASCILREENKLIVAEGTAWDLENNALIRKEVGRRIFTSEGHRYNDDMITMTGNAACSIALRNAILTLVPKAYWLEAYLATEKTSVGNIDNKQSREERLNQILDEFANFNVTQESVLSFFGYKKLDQINRDNFVTLLGFINAFKDNSLSPETIFNKENKSKADAFKDKLNQQEQDKLNKEEEAKNAN